MKLLTSSSSLIEWLDWLLNLHAQEIDLGLDRVRIVAGRLQVLKPAPFVISVAGTNGKGSSVAMLVAILTAAGYRVGSFTSPHIVRFNERIQLNGQDVADAVIVDAFSQIERARQAVKLTYFEFATLAALVIFSQSNLDVVVLEVGLGGRLDAVNIVDAQAALLTAIDIDHIEWLGSDRNKIGLEKAAIMRANALAICSDPHPPQSVIDYADQIHVDLRLLGRDYQYSFEHQAWCFEATNPNLMFSSLPKPNLAGEFQIQNAAGVIALLSAQRHLKLDQKILEQGLQAIKHPGRLQSLQHNHQAWLLDVAHNPQSVSALADHLNTAPTNGSRLAIFSALIDKDIEPMVAKMLPFVSHWVVVDLDVPRSTPLAQLQEVLRLCGVAPSKQSNFGSMSQAIAWVSQSNYEQVLVYGSFVTVSQALEELTHG